MPNVESLEAGADMLVDIGVYRERHVKRMGRRFEAPLEGHLAVFHYRLVAVEELDGRALVAVVEAVEPVDRARRASRSRARLRFAHLAGAWG